MRNYLHFLLLFLLLLPAVAPAQDFMMQGWYWDYPKRGCNGYPAGAPSWAVTLSGQITELKSAGFTYLWLPPFSKASFGNCSNGYDPQDLYDYGQYSGQTGLGTGVEVSGLIAALNTANLRPVADVVYNHRDGGAAETNTAVKEYAGGINGYGTANGGNPFPNDRYRIVLPIGGGTGLGAGTYYFKFSSKSGGYGGTPYVIYMNTASSTVPYSTAWEFEPNGGGQCGEPSNAIALNQDFSGHIDGSNCTIDELALTLNAADFNAGGDALTIFVKAGGGGYHDLRAFEIWYNSNNLVNSLQYQTYTNFNGLPSGQGGMNFESFRPNSNSYTFEKLDGDWNSMLFFYDYDQAQASTINTLNNWTTWLWNSAGIRGLRMDAVKHLNPAFIGQLMNHLHGNGINPGMVVGESFDFGANTLKSWVDQVVSHMTPAANAAINVRAFDFALTGALREACLNNDDSYDRRTLLNAGMVRQAGSSPFTVVTFVNNHDFRHSSEYNFDPLLGYAYILTNNQVGLPCVFYPDYYGVPLSDYYNPNAALKPQIDELMAANRNYINGALSWTPLSLEWQTYGQNFSGTSFGQPWNRTVAYQLSGTPTGNDVLVVLNFGNSTLNLTQQVNTSSSGLSIGSSMGKIAGPAGVTQSLSVSGSSTVTLSVPARSYGVWAGSGVVLPVALLRFEVESRDKTVLLQWTSASEERFAGYEVQRSLDGRTFEKIGWVDAKGTQNGLSEYAFTDRQPAFNRPMYYRLRLTDLDGTGTYSPMRSVTLSQVPQAVLFPNPAKGKLTLRLSAPVEADTALEVLDAYGRPVYSGILPAGSDMETLDMSGKPGGVYHARLRLAGEIIRGSTFVLY